MYATSDAAAYSTVDVASARYAALSLPEYEDAIEREPGSNSWSLVDRLQARTDAGGGSGPMNHDDSSASATSGTVVCT